MWDPNRRPHDLSDLWDVFKSRRPHNLGFERIFLGNSGYKSLAELVRENRTRGLSFRGMRIYSEEMKSEGIVSSEIVSCMDAIADNYIRSIKASSNSDEFTEILFGSFGKVDYPPKTLSDVPLLESIQISDTELRRLSTVRAIALAIMRCTNLKSLSFNRCSVPYDEKLDILWGCIATTEARISHLEMVNMPSFHSELEMEFVIDAISKHPIQYIHLDVLMYEAFWIMLKNMKHLQEVYLKYYGGNIKYIREKYVYNAFNGKELRVYRGPHPEQVKAGVSQDYRDKQ